MKRIRSQSALMLSILFLASARADKTPSSPPLSTEQDSPQAMARELGIKLPRRPWHLVNLWWTFDKPTTNFKRLDVDVTIDRDIPETYNLYIAPVGLGKLNGISFYGGIQSNINGWNSKQSRRRVHPGRGAIFSRWSSEEKKPIGLDHVRMQPGGLCESAGYEGEFCSVRRPYKWAAGQYTWSIVKAETIEHRGVPHTWFACEVTDKATGKVTRIGSLLFEGKTFTFWNRNSAFVEVYATSRIPASGIPVCHVTFAMPRINGELPGLKKAAVAYPRKSGPAAPPCARTFEDGSSIRVEVGAIQKDSEMDPGRELKLRLPEP